MTILTHQARPVRSGGNQISPHSAPGTATPSTHHARAASASAAGRGGAAGAALGINAKLRATLADTASRMADRFALQSVARSILPKSRTAKCLRIRAYQRDVEVWKSKEHNTASYGGLQTCGSVWTCPVCSSKIAERRRVEIQGAIATHRAQGGRPRAGAGIACQFADSARGRRPAAGPGRGQFTSPVPAGPSTAG
mgnify:CR=1 FL=1